MLNVILFRRDGARIVFQYLCPVALYKTLKHTLDFTIRTVVWYPYFVSHTEIYWDDKRFVLNKSVPRTKLLCIKVLDVFSYYYTFAFSQWISNLVLNLLDIKTLDVPQCGFNLGCKCIRFTKPVALRCDQVFIFVVDQCESQ